LVLIPTNRNFKMRERGDKGLPCETKTLREVEIPFRRMEGTPGHYHRDEERVLHWKVRVRKKPLQFIVLKVKETPVKNEGRG